MLSKVTSHNDECLQSALNYYKNNQKENQLIQKFLVKLFLTNTKARPESLELSRIHQLPILYLIFSSVCITN